jgi:hypothetical protein
LHGSGDDEDGRTVRALAVRRDDAEGSMVGRDRKTIALNFLSRREAKQRVAEVDVVIEADDGAHAIEADTHRIRRATLATEADPKLQRVVGVLLDPGVTEKTVDGVERRPGRSFWLALTQGTDEENAQSWAPAIELDSNRLSDAKVRDAVDIRLGFERNGTELR